MALKWNYPRYPLEDDFQNLLRLEQYWKYLLAAKPQDEVRAQVGCIEEFTIVPILNYAQADYEAFHMVHSIGLNFDKYSKQGLIYSIRTHNNIPVCTFSVADGICNQARQLGNTCVDDTVYDLLVRCCVLMGVRCAPRAQL